MATPRLKTIGKTALQLTLALLTLGGPAVADAALGCGTSGGRSGEPTANDALFVLQSAVGIPGLCGPCLCDVDDSGSVTAADALRVLRRSLGLAGELSCPACPCLPTTQITIPYSASELSLGDLDDDGIADIVFAVDGRRGEPGELVVMLAVDRGLFRELDHFATRGNRQGLTLGDFTDDGLTDVIVVGRNPVELLVFAGNGDGTLAAPIVTAATRSGPLTAADVNDDGLLDLIIAESYGFSLTIALGNGDGTFTELAPIESDTGSAGSVATSDFNHDGSIDIAAAGPNSDDVVILLGLGDGSFPTALVAATIADANQVTVADLDGDANPDLVISGSYASPFLTLVYANDEGGFEPPQELPLRGAPWTASVADVDSDGRNDIVVPLTGGDVTVVRGLGNREFDTSYTLNTGWSSPQIHVVDASGDGILDIIGGRRQDGELMIRHGRGDGSFEEPRVSRATASTVELLLGDVDADGTTDLVTADISSLSAYRGADRGLFDPRVLSPLPGVVRAAFGGDLNGDGLFDIVIEESVNTTALSADTTSERFGHDRNNQLAVLLGIGDGTFPWHRRIDNLVVASSAFGDVSGDGRSDIVALVAEAHQLKILAGTASGDFNASSSLDIGERDGRLDLIDFDGDGRLDIFLFQKTANIATIWGSLGDGTFAQPRDLTFVSAPTGAAAGDLNNDGRQDLVFQAGNLELVFGIEQNELSFPVAVNPRFSASDSPIVVDLDRDGAVDLAFIANSRQNIVVLPGNGDGSFGQPVVMTTRTPDGNRFREAIDLEVADLDGNGSLDLLVGHSGSDGNMVVMLPDPGNCIVP